VNDPGEGDVEQNTEELQMTDTMWQINRPGSAFVDAAMCKDTAALHDCKQQREIVAHLTSLKTTHMYTA
jgi:hypothetical protein